MYFVTVMTYEHLHWTEGNTGRSRCVGFFQYFSNANEAVLTNLDNIHESEYDYVVIEEIRQEGIYPWVDASCWYQWINGRYQRIEQPIEAKHLTNFCLG